MENSFDDETRPRQLAAKDPAYRRDLYPRIATASLLNNPDQFSRAVLEILCDVFPLRAASLYSFRPEHGKLILRGQYGLRYDLYKSFELPLETLAGQAATSRRSLSLPDVRNCSGYRDVELVNQFGLTAMIVVPLELPNQVEIQRPSPIGVLCAYPNTPGDPSGLTSQLEEISGFIAQLYVASLDQKKIRLRKRFIASVGYSHEMGGLMHRANRLFREILQLEAASIFLLDPRTDALRLMGTTGLPDGRRRETVFYQSGSTDPTYLAILENRVIDRAFDPDLFDPSKPLEVCATGPKSFICIPILEAAAAATRRQRPIGVIRGFNRSLCHDKVCHRASLGWEELDLADFYAEMVAVLVHFMRKGVNAENDFERRMHGAKNNLQAAVFNLQLLEKRGRVDPPPELRYALSDSIAFLSDIRAQIHRLELRHHDLPTYAVALYGEVLSKIPPMVARAARAARVPRFEVTQLDKAGFDRMPLVRGNRDALLSVFRNLAENAVKYCLTTVASNELRFSYKIENLSIVVTVTDFGMGIPARYREFLFMDGFRTPEAMARSPSGNGMGLSDCQDLMRRMEGEIWFDDEAIGTTFHVRIPLWDEDR